MVIKNELNYYVGKRTEDESLVFGKYDTFSGAIYYNTDIKMGARFDTVERAKAFINIQEQLDIMFGKDNDYVIVSEKIELATVEETV